MQKCVAFFMVFQLDSKMAKACQSRRSRTMMIPKIYLQQSASRTDLPTFGLFKLIRQPIYASFALTTWTTPNLTLDQLLIAVVFTAYCVIAPIFKEKRLEKRFGDKFTNYKSQVPYMIPSLSLKKQNSYQNRKRQSLRN